MSNIQSDNFLAKSCYNWNRSLPGEWNLGRLARYHLRQIARGVGTCLNTDWPRYLHFTNSRTMRC